MSAYIPCTPSGQAAWTQVTALDGVSFILTFRWSQREGHWTLDLADADGVPIRSGMLLVAGAVLLAGCLDSRRPAGEIVVVDTTGAEDVDPGFSDLGGAGARFVVQYVTALELAG
jgi:hypothetical protein